ncbi:hypothetical protein [Novipirellula artificiosorum]|nr:hypothetical protein [Novipirellula artificiosorum]
MRRIIYLSLASWVCFAFWALLFYCFWRLQWLRPHGVWAVASLSTMFGLSLWLDLIGLRSLWRGNRRVAVVGWMLIGIVPLASFGVHRLSSVETFQNRLPNRVTTLDRVSACWLSSFFHAASLAKLDRSVTGRHVVLLDQGQSKNPRDLVAQMDAHLEQMAARIGQAPPQQMIYWVRGSILGIDGFAVGPWAFCSRNEDAATLTPLDRHEVAHSLVFTLSGPDQNPPHLLVEGWAESQSNDDKAMIESLQRDRSVHRHHRIDDLVQHPYYGASRGPTYSHGGPFCLFLMQRYTPETFFKLYRGVRRDSFRSDAERVLGDPWLEVESQFWMWLKSEAEQISKERFVQDGRFENVIEFDEGVDREQWETLVEKCSLAEWTDHSIPHDVSYAVDLSFKDKRQHRTPLIDRHLKAVFDRQQCWITESQTPPTSERFLMITGEKIADLIRHQDGLVTGSSAGTQIRAEVNHEIYSLLERTHQPLDCNPWGYLPRQRNDLTYNENIRIHSVVAPSPTTTQWTIRFSKRMEYGKTERPSHEGQEVEREVEEEEVELRLGEANGMALSKLILMIQSTGERYTYEARCENVGGRIMPVKGVLTVLDDQSQVLAEGRVSTRRMTSQESLAVKQAVAAMAANVDTDFKSIWADDLRWFVFAVLVGGLVCVAIGREPPLPERHIGEVSSR